MEVSLNIRIGVSEFELEPDSIEIYPKGNIIRVYGENNESIDIPFKTKNNDAPAN